MRFMQCGFTFEQHYSDPAPSRWNFHLEPDAGPRILNHGHFNEKINEKSLGTYRKISCKSTFTAGKTNRIYLADFPTTGAHFQLAHH